MLFATNQSILTKLLFVLVAVTSQFSPHNNGGLVVVMAAMDCASLTCVPDSGVGYMTYKYGPSFVTSDGYENQVGDLYLPSVPITTPAVPIVVLIHGGYWYDQYRRKTTNGSDMRPLAVDLQSRGYAVVNLEYRRASDAYTNGIGRIPGTVNDISDGIDALSCQTELQTLCGYSDTINLDTDKVVVIGHSAGGHLALWSVLHYGIDGGNPYGINSSPIVQPIAAVGLAAVSDLYNGCISGTASASAIQNLHGVASCGGVDPYKAYTSPYQMLDTASTASVAFYLSHGSNDGTVSTIQSSNFVSAAANHPTNAALFDAQPNPFTTFPGEGHFDVIDPSSESWTTGVIPFLNSILPSCTFDEDCDDGLYCNGVETCVAGKCQSGTPILCDDSVACTVDTCNEVTDSCDHTPNDTACDNGVFCDGIEVCDTLLGCLSSGSPAACPFGCDTSLDQCYECSVNQDCDDSLWCNGNEVCTSGYCAFGIDPCIGQGCDEIIDECVACDNDGVCDAGAGGGEETCTTCPNDCIGGTTTGAVCGNGICETGDGEDCVSCAADCNGRQGGNPSNRFCCGDGDGVNPVTCSDSRCTTSGYQCTTIPSTPVSYCCGDGVCEGDETPCNCAADCAAPEICDDGIDNDCNGLTDCDDSSVCSTDPACDGGGTGGQCGVSKDPCIVNSDCCSNNCKGGECKGNRRRHLLFRGSTSSANLPAGYI